MQVMIAPMSYGALSASPQRVVGLASTLSGIAENTGEGGMSDAQRGAASQLIFQMLGGRLGWNIHDMNRADGLEIYISQGAKPGLGGQLMAKKVTPELAALGLLVARSAYDIVRTPKVPLDELNEALSGTLIEEMAESIASLPKWLDSEGELR